MRLVPLARLKPDPTPLTFTGARGEEVDIRVLDHDLVRVQMRPNGAPRLDRTWSVVDASGDVPREGRARDDLGPFPRPDCDVQTEPDRVTITTQKLRLTLALHNGAIQWADEAGRVFAADRATTAYAHDRAGRDVYHWMVSRPDEHYYGFGERSGPLDKRGRRMRMHNLDAMGYDAEHSDPLYKHIPFYITFVPELELAYGLFYDNLSITTFDMGAEIDAYHGPYRTYHAEDGDIEYYLLYGPTIPDVVAAFTRLTGRMILPPRWSLGYLGSTMHYTDAPDAQTQLARFVALCDAHDIPCDMFHLSSGYSMANDGRRYVFEWNHDRIPDPTAMIAHFHASGIRLAANIKPALLTTHPRYDALARRRAFICRADDDQPETGTFWGGEGAHLDFTNPLTYDWWQGRVRESLLDPGIDATWNDNNEFEVWDDAALCDGFGRPLPIGSLRPVQTLLMNRASCEAQRAARPDERPYLLSRSGGPGIQRYAATWSGDNTTAWNTLRYNIPMGLGLGLSGAPNTGHDVGGFAGPRPDPELFLRWVQSGIFQPRFCIHSWNSDGTVNEPWMYPDILPLVRDAIRFRYRLLPYLYTLFVTAAETGAPIARPLVYHFPQDPHCHTASFDFMLGPNLLVAPVFEPGLRSRTVYLPAGTAWCDFYSGEWHTGGQAVTVPAPLERIPLFVPTGGMIPLGPPMRHVGARPDDTREVRVFLPPGEAHGTFTLVEDDGLTLGYQRGEVTRLAITAQGDDRRIAVSVEAVQRGFPLAYDALDIVFPPTETRALHGEPGAAHTGPGLRVTLPPLE